MEFPWGTEEDGRGGMNYRLADDATAHAWSDGPSGQTPMVWERALGAGKVVVNNNDAFQFYKEKWSRGLIAAEFSLLGKCRAWPCINASVFFIDDFPAPVPEGTSPYIWRDYGCTVDYFLVNIWFPDMLKLARETGIQYTGALIETYDDDVTPPFRAGPGEARGAYFGKLMLNEGFEIVMHGYNHQSLVPQGFDYKGELAYNQWASMDDAAQSLAELVRYQEALFPGYVMRAYVPPSNVLSDEARRMIAERFPQVRALCGLYVNDIFGMEDEFGVGADGLVRFPRIDADYGVTTDQYWGVLSEVNMHFVNSHFVHSDDVLAEDRSAQMGWEWMKGEFSRFVGWVTRAPMRQVTASGGADAVERFDKLTLRQELRDGALALTIGGFYDEAWFLLRVNDGAPTGAQGGEITPLGGGLYLLRALSPEVTVPLAEGAGTAEGLAAAGGASGAAPIAWERR
jgi:hypothetical protein